MCSDDLKEYFDQDAEAWKLKDTVIVNGKVSCSFGRLVLSLGCLKRKKNSSRNNLLSQVCHTGCAMDASTVEEPPKVEVKVEMVDLSEEQSLREDIKPPVDPRLARLAATVSQ